MPIETQYGHQVKTVKVEGRHNAFTARYRELDADLTDGRTKNRWIEAGIIERLDEDGKIKWLPESTDGVPVGDPIDKRGDAAVALCELHYTPAQSEDGVPTPEAGAAPELDFLDEEEQNPDPIESSEGAPSSASEEAPSTVVEEQRAAHLDEDACDRAYRAWVNGYLGERGPITKHPLRDAFDAAWRLSRGR